MKKGIILLVLSITNLYAQDRIITTKSDTVVAKITSIDKQKVVYYLEADKDKKAVELPFTSLHKIVWRSGLEYVIDKELDEKLKKTVAPQIVVEAKSKQAENLNDVITAKPEIKIATPPELRVRRWGLWRTYTINGKRLHPDEQEKALYKYDLDNYYQYSDGNALRYTGRKTGRIVTAVSLGSSLIAPIFPLLVLGVDLGAFGVGVAASIKVWKGKHLMRKAVSNYENKRKNNNLRPRFSNNSL